MRLRLFGMEIKFIYILRFIGTFGKLFAFWKNKPERVFGLQVRCRELEFFEILFWNFLDFFWNFWGSFGIFLNFLGDFFLKFFRNFSEGFFWRNFFWRNFFWGIFWEKFFGRNFLEDFLGGFFGRIFWEIIGRIFWEEFFESNSLFTLELTYLSRFGFCQDFVSRQKKKEGNLDP